MSLLQWCNSLVPRAARRLSGSLLRCGWQGVLLLFSAGMWCSVTGHTWARKRCEGEQVDRGNLEMSIFFQSKWLPQGVLHPHCCVAHFKGQTRCRGFALTSSASTFSHTAGAQFVSRVYQWKQKRTASFCTDISERHMNTGPLFVTIRNPAHMLQMLVMLYAVVIATASLHRYSMNTPHIHHVWISSVSIFHRCSCCLFSFSIPLTV